MDAGPFRQASGRNGMSSQALHDIPVRDRGNFHRGQDGEDDIRRGPTVGHTISHELHEAIGIGGGTMVS